MFPTPVDFLQQFFFEHVLGGQRYNLRWIGSFEKKTCFFFTKIWYLIEILLLSKIQSRWSKLQYTCPGEQSEGSFFWKQNLKKVIGLTFSNFRPKFRQDCQNGIQHYQGKYLRKGRLFLRKFLFCVNVSEAEGWSLELWLKTQTGCQNVYRRTKREKFV